MSASVGLDTGLTREFSYSANDFEQLRQLARQHTGIELGQSKRELVYSRLVRRVRALGLGGFGAYADILQAGDSTEVERFANAITTNHTAFFREPHHFTFLREWLAQRRGRSAASIWSAGCSSGEEPYSIAMLAEMRPPASPAYHIVASDLNSTILARAVAGTYSIDRLATVDANLQRRFFLRGIGANLGAARVKNTLREHIEFCQLNLFGDWRFPKPFDIIFCRNVSIYFERTRRRELFERFAHALSPGGFLIVGHSESVFDCPDFRSVGRTIYQRLGT